MCTFTACRRKAVSNSFAVIWCVGIAFPPHAVESARTTAATPSTTSDFRAASIAHNLARDTQRPIPRQGSFRNTRAAEGLRGLAILLERIRLSATRYWRRLTCGGYE